MNKLKQTKSSIGENNHQTKIIVNQKSGSKFLTPQQIISLLYRSQQSKLNILKQIDQLNINTQSLAHLPLNQLYIQCQPAFKSTYSTKYLGLNNNQMGIISRRVDPNTTSKITTRKQQWETADQSSTVMITKYFYPKALKLGHKKKQNSEIINYKNLQNNIKKAFRSKQKAQNSSVQSKVKSKHDLYNTFKGVNTRVIGSWISKQKKRIHEQNVKVVMNNIENSMISHSNNQKSTSKQNSRVKQNNYLGVILPHLTYSKSWNHKIL